MRISQWLTAVFVVGAAPCGGPMGCAGPDDPPVAEESTALDAAGHLKGPAMMRDVFTDAFAPTKANVAINPTTDGTTATESALGVSQSFGAILDSAPGGYTDRIPLYTAEYFIAKSGTALAGITLTTTAAQNLMCPLAGPGSCVTSVGGVTPSGVYAPDTSDAKDAVFKDLCASRTLCTGIVLVADGGTARQWNGSTFVNFPITGVGKPCAVGDSQPVCSAKVGAITGNFVMGDSRVALGAGIKVLDLDSVTPNSTTIPNGTYPRSRAIHLLEPTTADTDTRVVNWWLWLDGDGTMAHPDHHADFLSIGTARGFLAGSL